MNPTTTQLAILVMPLIFLAAQWHGHSPPEARASGRADGTTLHPKTVAFGLGARFKALANAAVRSAGQP